MSLSSLKLPQKGQRKGPPGTPPPYTPCNQSRVPTTPRLPPPTPLHSSKPPSGKLEPTGEVPPQLQLRTPHPRCASAGSNARLSRWRTAGPWRVPQSQAGLRTSPQLLHHPLRRLQPGPDCRGRARAGRDRSRRGDSPPGSASSIADLRALPTGARRGPRHLKAPPAAARGIVGLVVRPGCGPAPCSRTHMWASRGLVRVPVPVSGRPIGRWGRVEAPSSPLPPQKCGRQPDPPPPASVPRTSVTAETTSAATRQKLRFVFPEAGSWERAAFYPTLSLR